LAKVNDVNDEGAKIRLIVFLLNDEWFGIEDIEAREVLRSARIYIVPKAPAYVNGVVNVRGDIIPVIDLAKFLGLKTPGKELSILAKILIIGKDTINIGLSVDHLEDIIEVEQKVLQTVDLMGEEAKFIKGKLEWNKKVITVLNIDNLVALPENSAVSS
jgi:purine-binding chemotaxis protein CheW